MTKKKIVILGTAGAGKTTLFYKIQNKKPRQQRTETDRSETFLYSVEKGEDPTELMLCDPSTVTSELLAQTDVCLYCINLADERLHFKINTIRHQMNKLRTDYPEVHLILVGTKSDQIAPEDHCTLDILNMFAKEFTVPQFQISATTNDTNITALMTSIITLQRLPPDQSAPRATPLEPSVDIFSASEPERPVSIQPPSPSPEDIAPPGLVYHLSIGLTLFAVVIFFMVLFLSMFSPPTLFSLATALPFLFLLNILEASFASAAIFSGPLFLLGGLLKIMDHLLKQKTSIEIDKEPRFPSGSCGQFGSALGGSTKSQPPAVTSHHSINASSPPPPSPKTPAPSEVPRH